MCVGGERCCGGSDSAGDRDDSRTRHETGGSDDATDGVFDDDDYQ